MNILHALALGGDVGTELEAMADNAIVTYNAALKSHVANLTPEQCAAFDDDVSRLATMIMHAVTGKTSIGAALMIANALASVGPRKSNPQAISALAVIIAGGFATQKVSP